MKNANLEDRIVYSPHIYGPDVYEHPYFTEEEGFPDNLNKIWKDQYGWIKSTLKKGVIVGEWGGSVQGKDGITQNMLSEFLKKNCMNNNFWWSLNPGSIDTGGILKADWWTIDQVKMDLLDKTQPFPSKVEFEDYGVKFLFLFYFFFC